MQHGMVDMVMVGADRVTYTGHTATSASLLCDETADDVLLRPGDVANKIGTYLKALAAKDCGVPFYVALGSSAIDWQCKDGVKEIPIEQRAPEEVTEIRGRCADDTVQTVRIVSEDSPAANYAFDVTPGRLVTGLILERGVCSASEAGVLGLYPEKAPAP
eukprot:scaffold206997_cov41-Prasinocladus_malaysianus.AAC.1